MRIRNSSEMMDSIRAAAAGVPRLRLMAKDLEHRLEWADTMVLRREEGGSETILSPSEADRIQVYHLLERDPLALRPNDPLASFVRVGFSHNRRLALGLFPHSADPFWHGLRLLTLLQELISERAFDALPIPQRPEPTFRRAQVLNAAAHARRSGYQVSRIALDVLDARFEGRIRHKTVELQLEGLITGQHLVNRMRSFMDHLAITEYPCRPASEEETVARVLATGQSIRALLEPAPPDPYN